MLCFAADEFQPRINTLSTQRNKYKSILQKNGIPEDYFERDFIEDNYLVDALSPLLTTNIEVIEETMGIQTVMLKALIGNFKYAMLFGFSTIENKGDSAISVGELNVIRNLGLELVYYCEDGYCHTDGIIDRARDISRYFSTDNVVILMHGGGNILSYLYEDAVRKIVWKHFHTTR